jgi:para-nitrobenzyl esterase
MSKTQGERTAGAWVRCARVLCTGGMCAGILCVALTIGPVWANVSPYGQVRERPIPGDPVRIDSGLVAGKLLPSGVKAWFGVPFAAPPVRDLRWREPQPVPPWSGVLEAVQQAPECVQMLRAHDINNYFGEEPTGEDCLYLNIWAAPDSDKPAPRPVVVWIYGGGFNIGSASMANYSGEMLARKGVIYVAIAYRVGPLGFLALPALTAESLHRSSGDYGLLDQIAGLRWVKRNIAAFGGDPANVTIMGQSAGSMSVSLLQASPLAQGLFHHVIGLSGSAVLDDPQWRPAPLEVAERDGRSLQEALRAPDLAALRNLPADRILVMSTNGRVHYAPDIDGYVLPGAPKDIFAAGKQNDVPTLIGFVHDESFSELGRVGTLADYRQKARELYGDKATELLKLYPANDDAQAARAARDAGRDSTLGVQMRSWARAQAATGKAPVYAYLFSRVHPYAPGVMFADHDPKTVGAYHSGDIPYWLGTLDAFNLLRVTRNWTVEDRALSEFMQNAVVSFASTGNPGHDWPVYQLEQERVMGLDVQRQVIPWPDVAKMDFFARNPAASRAAPPPPAPGRSRD